MVKSRAEIQRDYRRRKREKEGEEYLQRERERIKKYYTPISERSKKDVKQRREKIRKAVQKHRKERKEILKIIQTQNQQIETPSTVITSSACATVNEVSSTTGEENQPLIVKMPFSTNNHKARNRTRKRISRITAKQRREIKKLKDENQKLMKKVKSVSRGFQRARNKLDKFQQQKSMPNENMTPRKKVSTALRNSGLSPSKVPKPFLKKLLLADIISEEIKEARSSNGQHGKSIINKVISGAIVKKYRMKRQISRIIGMDRRTLATTTKTCDTRKRRRLLEMHERAKEKVYEFLSRDDNSRQMPGKKDVKTVDGSQKQKRVLNDSLKNLYTKFSSESRECKISFTTFTRLRPKEICLTQYISRNKCLCQKHQNMALLLKSVKSAGAEVPINPEEFIKRVAKNEINVNEIMAKINKEQIPYEQWKRVKCDDNKKRMKIVQKTVTKQELTSTFVQQTAEFQEHTKRIQEQYKAMGDLKNNLPNNHVIIQMDFSENFTCVSADEIQSAYWNAHAITLHPIVVYHKSDDRSLRHKNYMMVSDDLGHNTGSVFAFIKKLLPQLKEDIPNVQHIHYWTDSPSSQYRNKSIFYMVSNHESLFGIPATWNYFESGHGKGPCDGLGGTAKRMADLAVRQHKCTIQNAVEFYDWGRTCSRNIMYMYVGGVFIAEARSELDKLTSSIVPLKGTMQIHAVVAVSEGVVRTRVTSCYCAECINGNFHADWKQSDIRKASPRQNSVLEASNISESVAALPTDGNSDNACAPQELPANNNTSTSSVVPGTMNTDAVNGRTIDSLAIGRYVAVIYNSNWYIGKIMEIDSSDQTYHVTFMEKSVVAGSTCYKWPRRVDELWVDYKDIICPVCEPRPTGRYGRNFRLDDADFENVLHLYNMA